MILYYDKLYIIYFITKFIDYLHINKLAHKKLLYNC